MPGSDPDHWLHRLSAEEWLRAAVHELDRAQKALRAKQRRMGVAGARRAAGMAWNAVLVVAPDEHYGRSYVDHLKAMSVDATVPETVRMAAGALLETPLDSAIVQLGAGDTRVADAALAILEHARERANPTASA